MHRISVKKMIPLFLVILGSLSPAIVWADEAEQLRELCMEEQLNDQQGTDRSNYCPIANGEP